MATKKALVTGGGGGIAEALALRLDSRGYHLVLADIGQVRGGGVRGDPSSRG
jgi:NAD(P)-dependent dehydrogenase (short-subunit alcohol dehydrogenase family)